MLPLGLFLAGWWGSVGRMRDDQVIIPALCGLVWGILMDVVLFWRQIAKPYEASRFAAVVKAGVCSVSAYWALRDPTDTARNLQGMLGIRSFEVTTWMVVALIAVGGPALIYIQYRLTKAAAEWAYK